MYGMAKTGLLKYFKMIDKRECQKETFFEHSLFLQDQSKFNAASPISANFFWPSIVG